MDVKGSLGKVRTWFWLALVGSVATVFHYTLENSKPPDWLASLIQWVFGLSADAFDAFAAVTLPLWSAVSLGLLLTLFFSALIGMLIENNYRAKKKLGQATFANGELEHHNATLKDSNSALNQKLLELSNSLSDSQKLTVQLRAELDTAQKELKQVKINAKTVPFTMDALIGANAFLPPRYPSSHPKTARRLSPHEIASRTKTEILKAVMLCGKADEYARIDSIHELVSVGKSELEALLESLSYDGYVTKVKYGYNSTYQLTPKSKMHFKSIENNVPSELKFS
ncbi:hypothetical protein [Pseudomonas sp. TSRC2-2]|uniref:hypothetical protein n=1 Tax=unclassified Pseudomonas TaxID=196821 RepID=UPI003CE71C6B